MATCVSRCLLDVSDIVVGAYAAGLGCLVEDEIDLGVTVIDMGGGTTSLAVFYDGALVVAPGMGGTLPLYLFTEVAGKPAIVVPVANHDNNQHAPDENLRIANLWYAIDLYAALMTMPATVF